MKRRLNTSEVNDLIEAEIVGFGIEPGVEHFYWIDIEKDGKEYTVYAKDSGDGELFVEENL